MSNSWKLGRFAGIDVFLHPTFLMFLLYLGMTTRSAAVVGLFVAAFACVLLHEFGHALTARRFGIATQDITLYPIGGVARLERMPRSPGAEVLIALAGPAVNVAILLVLLLIHFLGGPGEVIPAWFLVNLGFINLMLVAFNLIPAFPMDGGRVFRALLSGWIGRLRATEIAAGLGRVLAVAFGVWSATQFEWMRVALAAFIYLAAGAELASVVADERRRLSAAFGVDTGAWAAPRGHQWVRNAEGVWALTPLVVTVPVEPQTHWR